MKSPQRFTAVLLVLLLLLTGCNEPIPKPVPEALELTPAPGAVDVPVDAIITAKFNIPLKPLELIEAFSLTTGVTILPGELTYDEESNTLTFIPASPLPAGTLITATVGIAAVSLHGKNLPEALEWSFTTKPEPEPEPEPKEPEPEEPEPEEPEPEEPEPGEPEPEEPGSGPISAPIPSLTITSHTDGDTITGNRNITITASLQDTQRSARINIHHNGTNNSYTRTGTTLSTGITLADHDNKITITVTNRGQPPATATINLDYPFITLENFQPASVVIGQKDFTTNNETDNEKRFSFPSHWPGIHNGTLYLTDFNHNRIMGYNTIPAENDASADFVIGQPDFDTFDSGVSSAKLYGPVSLFVAGDSLIVSDYGNHRLLIWDQAPTSNGRPADRVIGQINMDSNATGCTATSFNWPQASTVAGSKLIVPDSGGNRVLIWNDYTAAPHQPADLIIGQPDPTTCNEGLSQSSLDWPTSVWSDGTKLIVTDYLNLRVLIWNTFPTRSYQPADTVLGQTGFDTKNTAVDSSSLSAPASVHSNGNQLFVADPHTNRILIWNEIPTSNDTPADIVLGQPNMNSNQANAPAGSLNQQGLDYPSGVYAHGNQLFVADNDNSRYLIFEGINP